MANGLVNLQTDLKSLRYGNDKPYITKDINNPPSSNQTGMQITKRIDDLSRIAQMLVDRPGLKFIGNQALLHQVDIQGKLEKARDKKKTLGGKIFEQVKGTVLNTAKIIGSTIAQVPVNGTGTHFVYAFRTDTYLEPSSPGDTNAFTEFFGAGGVEGAPLALRGENITGKVKSKFGEPNQQTGEFKIGVESELGYDEKINSLLPGKSEYIKAKEGTTIIEDNLGQGGWKPYTSTGVKEQFVNRDTNKIVSQSLFVSKSIQDKERSIRTGQVRNSSIEIISPDTGTPLTIPQKETTAISGSFGRSNQTSGEITSGDVEIIPFREEDVETTRKSKSDTAQNVRNALSGSAIAIKREEGARETTADKDFRIPGSTSNQKIISDIPENSTSNVKSSYSPDKTYTGTKTQDNLNGAVEGKSIVVSKNSETVEGTRPINYSGNGKVLDKNSVNRNVRDFRTGPTSFNYSSPEINKETRINLGNQGKNTGKVSYSTIYQDKIDKLNALEVSGDRIDGTNAARDLAKFYFEIITPDEKKFLHFRAHIDSINDNYSGEWDSHQYVGRAEEFFTYKGFKRDISVGFKISAQSRAEMKPLYRKMVYLASATAPSYGGGSNFMRGTLARLTIGSYFSQIPGIITSVKYTWDPDYMWEIAMQNPEGGVDDDQQELPMTLNCAVDFKPIHDFAPQTGLKHFFTSPKPSNGSKPFF